MPCPDRALHMHTRPHCFLFSERLALWRPATTTEVVPCASKNPVVKTSRSAKRLKYIQRRQACGKKKVRKECQKNPYEMTKLEKQTQEASGWESRKKDGRKEGTKEARKGARKDAGKRKDSYFPSVSPTVHPRRALAADSARAPRSVGHNGIAWARRWWGARPVAAQLEVARPRPPLARSAADAGPRPGRWRGHSAQPGPETRPRVNRSQNHQQQQRGTPRTRSCKRKSPKKKNYVNSLLSHARFNHWRCLCETPRLLGPCAGPTGQGHTVHIMLHKGQGHRWLIGHMHVGPSICHGQRFSTLPRIREGCRRIRLPLVPCKRGKHHHTFNRGQSN